MITPVSKHSKENSLSHAASPTPHQEQQQLSTPFHTFTAGLKGSYKNSLKHTLARKKKTLGKPITGSLASPWKLCGKMLCLFGTTTEMGHAVKGISRSHLNVVFVFSQLWASFYCISFKRGSLMLQGLSCVCFHGYSRCLTSLFFYLQQRE